MKIAVMGSGGIGGYYGGRLAAAGEDVTFIARGDHLAAMQSTGLKLEGPHGNFHVHPCQATDDPSTIGVVDVVLFCVKLYDTEEAAELVKPIVGPNTMVVSLMNGVDGPERIEAVVGKGRVLGGAAYISALIAEPGFVRYISELHRIVFGELAGGDSDRVSEFLKVCLAAGLEASSSDDIVGALWTKFVLLATNAGLTSLVRKPTGVVYHDEDLVWLAENLMREVVEVAAARGITLADDVIDKSMTIVKQFPPDMYASMYHDLNRGKRMELASLSGLVARLGGELGVATPHHRTVYACLKPYRAGA
jgi:2-dehydropantoate 2-reductase